MSHGETKVYSGVQACGCAPDQGSRRLVRTGIRRPEGASDAAAQLGEGVEEDPQQAFPGQGNMKPEQLEIARLKREVIKLKAERDTPKKAAAYFAKEST